MLKAATKCTAKKCPNARKGSCLSQGVYAEQEQYERASEHIFSALLHSRHLTIQCIVCTPPAQNHPKIFRPEVPCSPAMPISCRCKEFAAGNTMYCQDKRHGNGWNRLCRTVFVLFLFGIPYVTKKAAVLTPQEGAYARRLWLAKIKNYPKTFG